MFKSEFKLVANILSSFIYDNEFTQLNKKNLLYKCWAFNNEEADRELLLLINEILNES